MSKQIASIVLFLSIAMLIMPLYAVQAIKPSHIIAGQYLLQFEDGVLPQDFEDDYDIKVLHKYKHAIKGLNFQANDIEIEKIKKDPRVKFVQRDAEVFITVQTLPTGIDRIDTELNPISKIDGIDERVDVDIAILDTGVQIDHPDLNVVDFVTFIGTPNVDVHGHGTHVAGTTAALDNGFGVVGMAPGARIHAYKVLGDNGGGTFGSVAAGIDFATGKADVIDVINMSLAGSGSDAGGCISGDIMHKAVCGAVAAGIVVVVAAANSNADSKFFVPAAYDEVFTISALRDLDGTFGGTGGSGDDTMAGFSNFGEDVDFIGPGVSILSTYKNSGYVKFSGTSMASPHVAGAVALYIVENGKPADEAGVLIVKEGLLKLAVPMSDPRGWTGDKDAFPEPLIWAATSVGDPVPPDPDPDPPPPDPPTPDPLVVEIITPQDGNVVTNRIFIIVEASSPNGVDSVGLVLDGKKLKGTDTTAPYEWTLQTKSKGNGEHTLIATACDANGCVTDTVTFTTANSKGK